MKILVLMKMVPDIVEELEVAADGKSLDLEASRPIVSESDDHALEQALLLKDRLGGSVVALGVESRDLDDVLFTALAKGSDRAVKVEGVEPPVTTAEVAALLAAVLPTVPGLMPVDLVVTGCQAIDDLDGLVAPFLAEALGIPYVGVVTGVEAKAGEGRVTVLKEYAGGVRARYGVTLPAVLGIQAAEKPPRYVPVAKVRATMKSGKIETVAAPARSWSPALEVLRMTKPEAAGQAEMLEGDPEAVASKVAEILSARGLL
ncbi:MAG: electron transfer flavoprotein subunit beta/FixA family protein [Gemmatimonadales bacterium]